MAINNKEIKNSIRRIKMQIELLEASSLFTDEEKNDLKIIYGSLIATYRRAGKRFYKQTKAELCI